MTKIYYAWFVEPMKNYSRFLVGQDTNREALYERCKLYLQKRYGPTDIWFVDDGYRLEHPDTMAVIVADPDIEIWSDPHDDLSTVALYMAWEDEFLPWDDKPSETFEQYVARSAEEIGETISND